MTAVSRAKRLGGRVSAMVRLTAMLSSRHRLGMRDDRAGAAAAEMTDRRVLWVDFDGMLNDLPAALARTCEHFGFPAEDGKLVEIASGPLTQRYSKALEYEYSAGLRRERIREAERNYGRQIESALAMLRSAAEKSPLLARSLSRAEG